MHRSANIVAKVPKANQNEVKKDFWRIFNNIEAAPGEAAIAVASTRAQDFERKYQALYPSAVECLVKDFSSLTPHLHVPVEHRERVRHTNLLERTFGETHRRTKVIGRLPGEQTCLVLGLGGAGPSQGWRGLEMTPNGVRRLQDLRRQLQPPPDSRRRRIAEAPQPGTYQKTHPCRSGLPGPS